MQPSVKEAPRGFFDSMKHDGYSFYSVFCGRRNSASFLCGGLFGWVKGRAPVSFTEDAALAHAPLLGRIEGRVALLEQGVDVHVRVAAPGDADAGGE